MSKTADRNTTAQADVIDAPKRRGRPPKAATTATQSSAAKVKQVASKAAAATTTDTTAAATAPKPRGRPRSSAAAVSVPSGTPAKRKRDDAVAVEAPPAKKRGRPPAAAAGAKPAAAPTVSTKRASRIPSPVVKKKRGRPATKPASVRQVTAGIRKPKKVTTSADTAAVSATKQSKTRVGSSKPTVTKPFKPATKATPRIRRVETDPDMDLTDAENTPEIQYWLMKAEPDSRIEKGVDVAFPIEKLAAATEPEPWDGTSILRLYAFCKWSNSRLGVRNPVARNHMRSMRLNDLAFFYHSNCKDPGIVGVMRIVAEHSIDESAFDPTHPYYDHKSDRSKPKWDCVKVEFVKKFEGPVSLKTLKSTPSLSGMQIAQKAYGRLSVQSVQPKEWAIVLDIAGEDHDLGQPAKTGGYEAGTDGETEADNIMQNKNEDGQVGGNDEIDPEKMAAYGSPEPGLESAAHRVNGELDTGPSTIIITDTDQPKLEHRETIEVVESTQPTVDGTPLTKTVVTDAITDTIRETTVTAVLGGTIEYDAMESDRDEIDD